MKKTCSLFFYLLLFISSFAQSDNIIGTWLTADKKAHIKIFKSNNHFYGKIVWMKDPNDVKTGKPILDNHNPDVSKRNLPIFGSVILFGFRFENNEFVGGRVYDCRDGKVYTGKLWLENNNVLKMRGYLGFFFKTEEWVRFKQ